MLIRPQDNPTPEELKQALGLPTVVESPFTAYRVEGNPWRTTDKYKGICNADNGRLYNIAHKTYNLVPHEKGLHDVLNTIHQHPEFGPVNVELHGHQDYKQLHARITFKDVLYEIKPGDAVNPTVEYFNSFDGSWAEKLTFGAFRLLCSNGLVIGTKFMTSCAVHRGAVERKFMHINLGAAMERFSYQTGIWQTWLDKELNIAHLDSMETLDLNRTEHQSVVDQIDPKMDLWAYYNLLTALITHNMRSLNKRVNNWNRLRAATNQW